VGEAGDADVAAGGLDSPQLAMIPITALARMKRCTLKAVRLPRRPFLVGRAAEWSGQGNLLAGSGKAHWISRSCVGGQGYKV